MIILINLLNFLSFFIVIFVVHSVTFFVYISTANVLF